MARTFSWIGLSVGNWQTASNWNDLTDGRNPSVLVPGSLDVVVGSATYLGIGQAAQISGGVFNGNFNIGTVTGPSVNAIGGTLVVGNIIDGSVLARGAVVNLSTITIQTLQGLAGASILASSGIDVRQGGTIIDSATYIGTSVQQMTIGVADTLSAIEIGGVIAKPGILRIENGSTLDITKTDPILHFSIAYAPTIDVEGLLRTDVLTLTDSMYDDSTPSGNVYGPIIGAGTVEVLKSGTLKVLSQVASNQLHFQVDDGATLELASIAPSGSNVELFNSAFLYLWNFTGNLSAPSGECPNFCV